jgi:2-dehydro-3-deoxy-L-rhamnonate dehydrogenase (NAD+)
MVAGRDLGARVALVTGGSRGIGAAVALMLAEAGAAVVVTYRERAADAEAVVARIKSSGGRAIAVAADVSQSAAVAGMVERVARELGPIDILVNNAGIAGVNKTVWDTDLDEWRKVLRINLDGPFICCKAIVPGMVKQNYGRIVNIASIAGKEGNPNAAHYSASKAGLIALTKSLGKELAGHEIAVNAVTPAAAKTAIFDQLTQQHIDFMLSKIPKGRFVLVEELAAMVAWLASEDCAFSTGAVFDISGGRATY